MSFRGVAAESDARFSNKHKKLLASTKYPENYSRKVAMSKVNLMVMKPWISKKLTEILGFEDDVLIEYVYGQLETEYPDPREIQIYLTGFLEKDTESFVHQLWTLLLDAQESIGGVPKVFLEEKKKELAAQHGLTGKSWITVKKGGTRKPSPDRGTHSPEDVNYGREAREGRREDKKSRWDDEKRDDRKGDRYDRVDRHDRRGDERVKEEKRDWRDERYRDDKPERSEVSSYRKRRDSRSRSRDRSRERRSSRSRSRDRRR